MEPFAEASVRLDSDLEDRGLLPVPAVAGVGSLAGTDGLEGSAVLDPWQGRLIRAGIRGHSIRGSRVLVAHDGTSDSRIYGRMTLIRDCEVELIGPGLRQARSDRSEAA